MRGAKPKEMPPDKGERGPPRQPGCLGRGRVKRAMYLRSIDFSFFLFVAILFFIIFLYLQVNCGVNLQLIYAALNII